MSTVTPESMIQQPESKVILLNITEMAITQTSSSSEYPSDFFIGNFCKQLFEKNHYQNVQFVLRPTNK